MTPDSKRKFWLVFYENNYFPTPIANSIERRFEQKRDNYLGYQEIEIDMEDLKK